MTDFDVTVSLSHTGKYGPGKNSVFGHFLSSAGKHHTFLKLFYNFEVRLWKCYKVTMDSLYFAFFTKLTQRWCNVVIYQCREDVNLDTAVTTLYWHLPLQHLWYTVKGMYYPTLRQRNVQLSEFDFTTILTLWRRYEFDVAILTL